MTLKRVVLISFSGGAGFAFALAVVVAFWDWQAKRPKPWNQSAVTASFQKADCITSEAGPGQPPPIAGEDCHFGLRFAVRNNTSTDLVVKKGTEVLTRMSNSGTLRPLNGIRAYGARVSDDVFLPAGQSATLDVITLGRCQEDDWEVCKRENFSETQSLVVFLRESRYQIEFPLR